MSEIGYGKYQRMMLVLCGFGWLNDNLAMQNISLSLSDIQKTFAVNDALIGLYPSLFNLGLFVGSIVLGIASDTVFGSI